MSTNIGKFYNEEQKMSFQSKDTDLSTSEMGKMNIKKVFVIGMGSFDTAAAQGLRES